jgi:hypothetical protein
MPPRRGFPEGDAQEQAPANMCAVACKDFSCCLSDKLCTKQCERVEICGLCDKFQTCVPDKKLAVQGLNSPRLDVNKILVAYKTEITVIDRLKSEISKIPAWNYMAKREIVKRGKIAERRAKMIKEMLDYFGIRVDSK